MFLIGKKPSKPIICCSQSSVDFRNGNWVQQLELYPGNAVFCGVHGYSQELDGASWYQNDGNKLVLNVGPNTPSISQNLSEVVVIDKEGVDKLVDWVKQWNFSPKAKELKCSKEEVFQRIQQIADFVGEFFGGPNITQRDWENMSKFQRAQSQHGCVLLTQLRCGLQLHRALLFKAIWDSLPEEYHLVDFPNGKVPCYVLARKLQLAQPDAELTVKILEDSWRLNFMKAPVEWEKLKSIQQRSESQEVVNYEDVVGGMYKGSVRSVTMISQETKSADLPGIDFSNSQIGNLPNSSGNIQVQDLTIDSRINLSDVSHKKHIGSGSFSKIYKAKSQAHGYLAIKQMVFTQPNNIQTNAIGPDPDELLDKEIQLLSTCRHQNIIDFDIMIEELIMDVLFVNNL
eukprot:TRINITY_DN7732_c1_g1_i6.p1 TRINITY_DN7732_c1_g1~~TRINITY_DN7732_c1_g1_i6.p1  ORF type:complete len:424 (-),score=19.30 TRINITY_DN7732_c1_g1_i6:34-1233(-)